MSMIEIVRESMQFWPPIQAGDGVVVVPTHAVYPSGSVVNTFVQVGRKHAQVSDGGGAFDEILKSGDVGGPILNTLKSRAKRHGLTADNRGWLLSPEAPVEQLPALVALVASASNSCAEFLLNKFKPTKQVDYREEVKAFLNSTFNDQLHVGQKIMGAEKKHKFDFVIDLTAQTQLVLDLVVPNANSINSAVVAHLDLRHAKKPNIQQRIVFNKEDDWSSSDLSLLEIGAKVVSHTALPDTLKRLAA